jgi:hypothetical protein
LIFSRLSSVYTRDATRETRSDLVYRVPDLDGERSNYGFYDSRINTRGRTSSNKSRMNTSTWHALNFMRTLLLCSVLFISFTYTPLPSFSDKCVHTLGARNTRTLWDIFLSCSLIE